MQYRIFEGNMERLEKKLQRISNKCKKYGNDFLYKKIGEEFREDSDEYGNKYFSKYYIVDVSGTALISNKWRFVAVLEHQDHGNIIKKSPDAIDIEIPERYYTSDSICEHCNSNRRRRNTYILQNTETGEFKQVGKSCLMDFTAGMSAERVTNYISLYDEIIQGEEPCEGSHRVKYIDVTTALLYILETVNKFGYVKADGDRSTKERALEYYLVENEKNSFLFEVRRSLEREMENVSFRADTEENRKKINDVITWILDQEENNDWIHNLKSLCKGKYVTFSNFGILASLIPCYNRAMEKKARIEREKESSKGSQHIGNIKDRITVEIQNSKIVTSWETEFGVTVIHKIVDIDGNVYTWKTSKAIDENAKKIVGTVKAHNEYNGVKQTELTRCRIVA